MSLEYLLRFGEDKNLLSLPGIIPQFLSHSACRIITILNELCSLPALILCEINCMLSDIELYSQWVNNKNCMLVT